MWRANSLEKIPMLGEIEGKEEKGTTENEMVGWHHQLDEHQFVQTLGDGEIQGSLVCCSPWGHKESDRAEQLNNNNKLMGTDIFSVETAWRALHYSVTK